MLLELKRLKLSLGEGEKIAFQMSVKWEGIIEKYQSEKQETLEGCSFTTSLSCPPPPFISFLPSFLISFNVPFIYILNTGINKIKYFYHLLIWVSRHDINFYGFSLAIQMPLISVQKGGHPTQIQNLPTRAFLKGTNGSRRGLPPHTHICINLNLTLPPPPPFCPNHTFPAFPNLWWILPWSKP